MSQVASTGAVVAGTKALWAVVGVLGAAVVGLGGTLYYTQRAPAVEASGVAPVVAEATPATGPAVTSAAEVPAPAVVEAPAKPKHVVAKPVKRSAPAPVPAAPVAVVTPAPAPAPEVIPPPAPVPICVGCATVASVTPVEKDAQQTNGTGAVAGGVLGALVGNQVGHGSGRAVATLLGAIGGGVAGNEVEKKVKKTLVYEVKLHMDDGRRQTLELDHPLTVGARVRYDGHTVQPLAG